MKKIVKNQLSYWFPVYVWAALVFYFSSGALAGPSIPSGKALIMVSDYYKHILAYGFLTFLSWRAFHKSRFGYSGVFAIMIAFLYGAGNELYQYFIPGRVPSVYDTFFNFVGCVLVQPLIMLYKNFRK